MSWHHYGATLFSNLDHAAQDVAGDGVEEAGQVGVAPEETQQHQRGVGQAQPALGGGRAPRLSYKIIRVPVVFCSKSKQISQNSK